MPTCANICHHVPKWANIAACQLCRERQPLWNSHDGPELNSFRNPGAGKSRISQDNGSEYIYAGLLRHAFVDTSLNN